MLFQEKPFMRFGVGPALVCSILLVGCNRGDNDDNSADDGHDHDHPHVESLGRLVISDATQPRTTVYDLDAGEMLTTFDVVHPVTAIYSSPNRRYAVVMQRNNDEVRFVDSGLYQEDHGDHLHDYKEEPQLLSVVLNDRRPTHYEVHDNFAAIFFDGSSDPNLPAKVTVLSDPSIEGGREEAVLPLSTYMHGTAEPRGEWLLTTYRATEAEGTLPSQVELYQRNGVEYDFIQRFDEPCPGLHGSFSNEDYSLFGCTDGVLGVKQEGASFTGFKIPNGAEVAAEGRIGTIVGHHGLAQFGGFAGSDLFILDPANRTMAKVDWAGGSGVTRIAHAMDAHGEHFVILDSQGALHILDTADHWATTSVVPVVATILDANTPVIAASQSGHTIFVTDPSAQQIVEVDLETGSIARRISLDFQPAKLGWVGLAEPEHEE